MSLLDSLGQNNTQTTKNNTNNNIAHSMKYVSALLKGRNMNARDVAINMINQNRNMSGQLKEFLISNGVTDEQLRQNGINI